MTVRYGTERDADAVLAMHCAEPGLPQWQRDGFALSHQEEGAPGPLRRVLVAEDTGGLAGYAQVAIVADEAELESIVVDTWRRRSGVGTLLLEAVVAFARANGATVLRLEVRAGNEAAVALYRANGFQVTGSRRSYYSHPEEDALLLERWWPPDGELLQPIRYDRR